MTGTMCVRRLAQLLQDGEAVYVRHRKIQQHQAWRFPFQPIQRHAAIFGCHHGKAREPRCDETLIGVPGLWVIVHDQDSAARWRWLQRLDQVGQCLRLQWFH